MLRSNLLTNDVLSVRFHEKIVAELGKVLTHLHGDNRHEKAARFIDGYCIAFLFIGSVRFNFKLIQIGY